MLKNYIKIAWRNLWKHRLSSFINISGLTLGISSCMVILVFVGYETTFDAHHSKADQTYRVVQHNQLPDQVQHWNTTAYPLAEALRNDFPEIDMVTQVAGPMSREFSIHDSPKKPRRFQESHVLFVDPFYPKTFDMEWLAGDSNSALSDPNSVVLTAPLVKKFFGFDSDNYAAALGKTLLIQDKDPLTVTGVVKSPPGNSDHQYKILVPYEFFKINNPYFSSNWSGNYQGTTFVVLQEETLKKTLETKIANWKKKYLNPQDDKRISYRLQALTEIHNETLYGGSPGGYIMPSNVLFIASMVALFILFVAIVNFVNLLTAQSNSRSKEVGIRKVMGSKRSELILQFMLENSMLILATLGLSILTVAFLTDAINANLSIIDLQLAFGWQHIGLILAIGGVTILLASTYPAAVLSAHKPIQALKNRQGTRTRGAGLRKSLVAFQFVIVQVFVIAAIILALQMNHFQNGPLGFDREAVVITETPVFEKLDVFRNRLLEDPGITEVAYGSGPPMAVHGIQLGTSYRLPEQAAEEALEAEMKIGDVHYLDFYGLELLAGRNFLTNKEAFDEFIVNETFIKPFGWQPEEAIGKKIQINEGQATIVGVAKDFHNNSLQYKITPCVLLNWTYFQNQAFVKMTGTDYGSLSHMEKIWKQTFDTSVYQYHFLNESIEREYAIEQMIFYGFGIFSFLAISIGCLGLFGLMYFVVSKKVKEIGIRKVLGASLYQNLAFFMKEYIGLVSLAFVVAAPIVYYFMNLWLEGFTNRIALSFWMFLCGGLATLLIAMVTCSYQSLKASLANPVKALQEE